MSYISTDTVATGGAKIGSPVPGDLKPISLNIMKNTTDLKGGDNDEAATKLPEQNEKGSAAATTEPANDNHAGQPELITQKEVITAPAPVDAEGSNNDSTPSSRVTSDDMGPDGFDYDDRLIDALHDQMVIDQVLSEGGTLDDANEILHNLYWYGSRYEPGGSADDGFDYSDLIRAVSGQSQEI